jgi:hypothetical protein
MPEQTPILVKSNKIQSKQYEIHHVCNQVKNYWTQEQTEHKNHNQEENPSKGIDPQTDRIIMSRCIRIKLSIGSSQRRKMIKVQGNIDKNYSRFLSDSMFCDLNIGIPTPKYVCWSPIPNIIVLRGGAFFGGD